MKTPRTPQQEAIANKLAEQLGIDAERVLFLNSDKPEEPWLNAEALITVARRTGDFQAIEEAFNQYISPLNQIVHTATVIDKNGRSYTRSGVATVGESEDIGDHELASGRAISKALTAAGFHPLRAGAGVTLDLQLPAGNEPTPAVAAEAHARTIDLKRIHTIAAEKGLITFGRNNERDTGEYRKVLKDKFGVGSVVAMDETTRASFINYLEQLPDVDEFAQETAA